MQSSAKSTAFAPTSSSAETPVTPIGFKGKLPLVQTMLKLKEVLLKVPQIANNNALPFDIHHEIFCLLNQVTTNVHNVSRFVRVYNNVVDKLHNTEKDLTKLQGKLSGQEAAGAELPWRPLSSDAGFMQTGPSGGSEETSGHPGATGSTAADTQELEAVVDSLSNALSQRDDTIMLLQTQKEELEKQVATVRRETMVPDGRGWDPAGSDAGKRGCGHKVKHKVDPITSSGRKNGVYSEDKVNFLVDMDTDEAGVSIMLGMDKDFNAVRMVPAQGTGVLVQSASAIGESALQELLESPVSSSQFSTAMPNVGSDPPCLRAVQAIRSHNAIAKLHNSSLATRDGPLIGLWDHTSSPPGPVKATDFPTTVQNAWHMSETMVEKLVVALRIEGVTRARWIAMDVEGKRDTILDFCGIRTEEVFELWDL